MFLRNLILTVVLGVLAVLASCDSGDNISTSTSTSTSTTTEHRTYAYDANGRLVSVKNTNGSSIQYAYDSAGNVLAQNNKGEVQ